MTILRFQRMLATLAIFALLGLPSASLASILVTDPADLSGTDSSRSTPLSGTPGGLTGQGIWADSGILLDWSIAFNSGTNLWDYSYTLTRSGQGGVSHWILELTKSLGASFWQSVFDSASLTGVDDFSVGNNTPDPPTGPGDNPGMPADIWGIKFNVDGDSTVSFSVVQAPVWGDFYAKDGKAGTSGGVFNAVWNAGFSEPSSTDQGGPASTSDPNFPLYWVPRPNGGTGPPPPPPLIPEPISAIVWSLLVGAASAISLRRQRC